MEQSKKKGRLVVGKQCTVLEKNKNRTIHKKSGSCPNPLKSIELKEGKVPWSKKYSSKKMSQEELRKLVPSLSKKKGT